jgi:hypothetical protein
MHDENLDYRIEQFEITPASPLLGHLIALGTPEQLDGVRRHVGAT